MKYNKPIRVSEEVKKTLKDIKQKNRYRSIDDSIRRLIEKDARTK